MFDASTLQALAWAAAGCGFTWLMTTAGSAVVLFTGKDPERGKLAHHIFLGFAAGVMIAASVWSLLIPAIERVLLIKDAQVFADGPKEELLTSDAMSELFGVPLEVSERNGWYALQGRY